MDKFSLYTQGDVWALVNERPGEDKLGQHVQVASTLDGIGASTAKFVVLGIPEDIGIRANLGIGGAKTAFVSTLKALLNLQSNPFLKGDELMILGQFEIEEPRDQSTNSLRQKTAEIDALVSPIIHKVISAGKIPIVIGGGHNNAAPIIAGAAKALNQAIHVVNIDAHADLRDPNEGRHSGNGFSFALQAGQLESYRIFGLHQNYTHQNLPNYIAENANIRALYFEELLQSPLSITENWLNFIKDLPSPCGLEIDLDSLEKVLASAYTPSGFSLNEIRKILLSNTTGFCYLHLCEGATALSDGRIDSSTGKTIAYLITDFIKALLPRIAPRP